MKAIAPILLLQIVLALWASETAFLHPALAADDRTQGGGGVDTTQPYIAFDGEKSTWHEGFDRYDFIMDISTHTITPFKSPENEHFAVGVPPAGTRRCVVVCPKKPARGNPWSWRGCYWDHQPQTEIELLRRGFHIAYISADASLKPDEQWDTWYQFLTDKHGLSKKPAFIGMSRGGEYALMWATTHLDSVSCIYADNPGGNSEVLRRIGDLAQKDVPLLLVCGTIDPILPKYAMVMENTYQRSGGRVSMVLKEGAGHHPHSLNDPKPIADFIERSVQESPRKLPGFVGGNQFSRFAYYSLDNSYSYFPEDGYYLTRRGAEFTDCFDRYEVSLGFAVPVTIIAPNKVAQGTPWVFRAGFVDRDAWVDQALLKAGYHIVVGPVGFGSDGPVPAEWDKLYHYLTDHGFSTKPVIEGEGGGAGAAYAWAIDNPDKVACLYAENPVLHTAGVRIQPLENLASLAKAGIEIMHVCGSLDPAIDTQLPIAQKYKALGGSMKVLVREGEGHHLARSKDLQSITDFITRH